MHRTAIPVALAMTVGAAAVLAAGQLGGIQTSQPNFTPGPVPVTITNRPGIMVTNEPTVMARQNGPWIVTLADQPVTIRTTPAFMQAGETYTFNWPGGGSEEHLVTAVAPNGWVQVEAADDRAKWLNVTVAESIEMSAAEPGADAPPRPEEDGLELGFLLTVALSAGAGLLLRARVSRTAGRCVLALGLGASILAVVVLGLAVARWAPFGSLTAGLTAVVLIGIASITLPFAVTVSWGRISADADPPAGKTR